MRHVSVVVVALLLCACGSEPKESEGAVEGGVQPPVLPTNQLLLGYQFGCLKKADQAWCWGINNPTVRRPNGESAPVAPVPVPDAGEFVQMAAGSDHVCGVKRDGAVFCWTTEGFEWAVAREPDAGPGDVPGVGDIVQMDSGDRHSCGRTSDGHVQCWGDPSSQSVGGGGQARVATLAIEQAQEISSSSSGNCALLSDGSVQCWGKDVGFVHPDLSGAAKVFTGHGAVCARLEDGRTECRGNSFWSQAAGEDVAEVDLKDNYNACLITNSGEVRCWGNDDSENFFSSETPVTISGVSNAVQVRTTSSGGCALTDEARVFCWSLYLDGTRPALEAYEILGFD